MIEVKNLYLKYIREYYALYDINLKINKNEVVCLTGKEHSGRTTLLRAIAGLEKFDSGEIYLNGRNLNTVNFKTDINLGYIPAMPVFFENKTVYENLKYVLTERNIPHLEIENKINSALIEYHIEKYKDIVVKDLDIYEKYLISFIRLTLRELDVLLIDDIFSKLSDDDKTALIEMVKDLFTNKNTTIVIACSNFEPFKSFATREVKFNAGSIIE